MEPQQLETQEELKVPEGSSNTTTISLELTAWQTKIIDKQTLRHIVSQFIELQAETL